MGVVVLMLILVRVLLASALRGPTAVYSGAVIGVRRPRLRFKWCCNFALVLSSGLAGRVPLPAARGEAEK